MSENVASGLPALSGAGFRRFGPLVAGIAGLSLVLAVSRAYNTDDLAFWHRLVLWLVVCSMIAGQVIALDRMLAFAKDPHWIARLVTGAAAVAMTVWLATIELHLLKFTPLLPKKPDPFFEFLLFLAPPVGTIAGMVLLLSPAPDTRAKDEAAAAADADPPARPDGKVLLVHAQDHYVEIVSRAGRGISRARMKDVVQRLRAEDGLHVHRSWWVARAHVAAVERTGRDVVVRTKTGEEVPVSRSRFRLLKENGWL